MMIKMPLLFTSFPGWQKISDTDLAAGPYTDVDITGLNLTENNNYMIIITLQDNSVAGSTVSFYINGDTTGPNYASAINRPVTNVMTRSTSSDAVIFNLGINDVVLFQGILTLNTVAGPILIGNYAQDVGGVMEIRQSTSNYNALSGNITRLTLHSSVTNGIYQQGKVQIFKTI